MCDRSVDISISLSVQCMTPLKDDNTTGIMLMFSKLLVFILS